MDAPTMRLKPSFWGYLVLLAGANLIWAGQGAAAVAGSAIVLVATLLIMRYDPDSC
jgi:hypothetical protein